jgi:hypothetical protein
MNIESRLNLYKKKAEKAKNPEAGSLSQDKSNPPDPSQDNQLGNFMENGQDNQIFSRKIRIPGFIPRKNRYGRYWVRMISFPFANGNVKGIKSGSIEKGNLSTRGGAEIQFISKGLKDAERIKLILSGLVFLDIETTALRPGTGNIPFLIGFSVIKKEGLLLKQFFLENYFHEKAVLLALQRDLRNFFSLVTYNGKMFDVPLLTGRFQMNGLEKSIQDMPNIDLLPIARRIYKGKLKAFSLGKIEESILGIFRKNDIAAKDIPAAYFAYQRKGEVRDMNRVLYHHQLDIINLFSLLIKIAEDSLRRKDPEILVSLFELAVKQKQWGRAGTLLEKIEIIQKDVSLDFKSFPNLEYFMALSYKRAKKWDKARQIWERNAARDYRHCLDLAKYLEHFIKDYQGALSWLHILKKNLTLGQEVHRQEIEKRLLRIEKKAQKNS